ncbi:MAG: 1-acyl-sn-glycerol-3-phosphate acyltransferase [Alphaproteobacteria bacterium]|nr:1-acyl-sn-glycerol-3-phosphate acyltransferase [Alphaproteobacteria bacterium]
MGRLKGPAAAGAELTLPTSQISRTIAILRTVVFFLSAIVILALLFPMLVLRLETGPLKRRYFAFLARLLGIRLVMAGAPTKQRPCLFVCNHVSYLDVVALGAIVQAEFVSRADLADWPLFGLMAKAGNTVFIDRRRRATGDARDKMQERIGRHRALIMFPESTSGNGNYLLPFKSALFNVAEAGLDGRAITVQPVSIAYTRMNGMPIGVGWRSFWAWYGDMTLMPHLWSLLQLGRTTIEIEFHDPVAATDFADRKALAAHCHKIIGHGVARLLSGRSA